MSALRNKKGVETAESDGPIMTREQLQLVWHWHNEASHAASAVEYWRDREPMDMAQLESAKERLATALARLADVQKLD